jgi:hypothetical protein
LSLQDILTEFEHRVRAVKGDVSFIPLQSMLERLLANETPSHYVFGSGFAPDNPSTLVDVLILTENFIYALDVEPNKESSFFIRIPEIKYVMVRRFPERVKLELSLELANFFINADPKDLSKIEEFAVAVHELMKRNR